MPTYKVIEVAGRAADKTGTPCMQFTFSIDGCEVLRRWPRCKVPGMSEDYYVTRTIGRLQAGRSGAFGGPGIEPVRLLADGASVKRTASVKELGSRRWAFILDGEQDKEEYTTERAAREACSCKVFLTSGKLGKLKMIEDAFKTKHGVDCKCVVGDCKVLVVTEDDKKFKASMNREGVVKFQETS